MKEKQLDEVLAIIDNVSTETPSEFAPGVICYSGEMNLVIIHCSQGDEV